MYFFKLIKQGAFVLDQKYLRFSPISFGRAAAHWQAHGAK